jgi:hypothetical protein
MLGKAVMGLMLNSNNKSNLMRVYVCKPQVILRIISEEKISLAQRIKIRHWVTLLLICSLNNLRLGRLLHYTKN